MPLDPVLKKFIDKAVSEGRTANDIGKSISEAGWGLSHIQEAERYYGSKKKSSQSTSEMESGASTSRGPVTTSSLGLPQDVVDFSIGQQKKYGLLSESGQPTENVNKGYIWEATEPEDESYGRVFNAFSEIEAKRKEIEETSASPTYRGPVNERPQYYRPTGFPTSGFGMGMGSAMGAGMQSPYDTRPALSEDNRQSRIAQLQKEKKEAAQNFIKQSEISYNALLPKARAYGEEVPDFYDFNGDPSQGIDWVTSKAGKYQKEQLSKLREDAIKEAEKSNWAGRGLNSFVYNFFGAADAFGAAINFAGQTAVGGKPWEDDYTETELGQFAREGSEMVRKGAIGEKFLAGYTLDEIQKGVSKNILEGNYEAGLGLLGLESLEMVPQLAAAMAPGGVGLRLLATTSAGDAWARVATDPKYNTAEKIAYAGILGLAEYYTEKIFSADRDAIRGMVNFVQQNGRKGLGEAMFGKLPKGLRAFVEEGFEESVVDLVTQGLDFAMAGKEFDAYQLADATVLGGVMGGGAFVLSKSPNALGRIPGLQTKIKFDSDIQRIKDILDSKDLSPEERGVLSARLNDLLAESRRTEEQNMMFYEAYSEEDKKRTYELNQEVLRLMELHKKTKTDIAKKAIAEDIKQKISEIQQIESNYDSKKGQQVPSQVAQGQELGPVPIEGRSAEEAETSGVLQEVEDEEKLAGEKTQALEQEQPDLEPSNFDNVTEETAPTVANTLYDYISNTAEAAFKALGTSRRQAARAADSVSNVINSLTKAGKKVNVKVFYSKASMEDWLGSIGEKPEAARGIYVPPGSENKNEITIGLLAPALVSNTAYHEGLHSIVPAVFGEDGIKRLFKVLMNKLSKSDALGEYLRDFASSEQYQESEDQWEEFSVELASLIADGSVSISVKKGIIDKFMDAMSEVLGIVGIEVRPSAAQLVNILNDYAQKLGAGVELGEIPEIFDTEELNEMANGDIESEPFIETEIVAPTNVKRQDIVFPKSGTYPVSKIIKSDVKDIEAFLKEQVKLGKTFAFWYADQFGRGNYVDPYTGEEYFLDGGPSFPFDPKNKKNGDVWASSADTGSLYNALIKNRDGKRVPDFIVQISGHPTKMMQFNRVFNEIWINRAKKAFPNINDFKKALTSISKTKPIMFFVENMTSWDEMLSDTVNENLKEVKKETIGKKGNVKVTTEYVSKYAEVRTAIAFIKSIEKVPPGEKGELADTKVYNLLFENGLHPSNFNDARDGYFRKYDFQEGEILCIYKVTDVVENAGVHKTYSNSIKGEPVLIPNARVFAFDLMPEEIRTRRKAKGTDSEGKIIWGEELQNLSKSAIQKAMAPDFPTQYPITTDEKQIERAITKLSRKLPKAQRITESSEKLEKLFRRDGIALTKEEAAEILTEVDSWRDWYDGISSLVEEVFGEYAADYMMFMFGSAMAANSASTIGGSINNLDRFYKEEALKGLPLVKQNIYRSMLGLEVNSRKIQQFINAGLGDKNAKPIDMHVWSFMNSFSKTKNPNEVQFKKGLDFVDDVAEVLGWDPREVQATMWAANILRLGGKPDTYEEYIRRKVDKGLNKTIQGWRNKGIKPVFKIVKDGERLKTEYAKEVDREALESNLEDINQRIAQAIEERRLKAKQAKKETIITSLSERFKGDRFLDLQDTLDELLTSLADVDAEGNVTLYHRTTKENKSQIQKSGQMKGEEDGLFFSTTRDGQAEGYGEAIIKLKVPIEDIQIDDLFEAEAHVRIPTSKAGQIVNVSEYLEKAKPKKPKVKFQLPLLEEESSTTQVATTIGSYAKAANIAKRLGAKNILDYGAGLGLGSDAMRNVVSNVDSFEPFPERWKGKTPPTYTDNTDIEKKYDAVVSLNVLNVVRKDLRDAIVKDIFSLLNDNGAAIISTRAFKGDIAKAKNFENGPEDKSYIIKRKQDGKVIDVFQKGFDSNELVDYLQELLGDEAVVRKDNSYGAAGAIITKSPKVKQQEGPTQKAMLQIIGSNADLKEWTSKMLLKANEMERRGVKPKTIFNVTGWERGADKKWKYPVPPFKLDYTKVAQFNEGPIGNTVNLYDLIENNGRFKSEFSSGIEYYAHSNEGRTKENEDVFDFYPSFANMKVTLSETDGPTFFRYVKMPGQKALGSITISKYWHDKSPDHFLFALTHEIQHAVQREEGFAVGGSVATVDEEIDKVIEEDKKILANKEKLIPALKDRIKLEEEKVQWYIDNGYSQRDILNDGVLNTLEGLNIQLRMIEDTERQLAYLKGVRASKDLSKRDKYVALAGEIEANNAAKRAVAAVAKGGPTIQMLVETEDIPREYQIIITPDIEEVSSPAYLKKLKAQKISNAKNFKKDVPKISRMSAGSFSGRMYNYLLSLTTEEDQGQRKIAISKTEWVNTMAPIIGANEASDMYDNVLNDKIPQDAIDTSLTSNIDKAYEDSLGKIERETRKAVFTIENLIVKLTDRQHLIKAAILKANISRVKNLIVNKAGSSSRALHFVRSWEKRIYKGLSEEEAVLLDKLIALRRVKTIDDNFAQRYNDALDEYNDAMQQLSNQQPGTPKYDKLLAKAERAQRKMEEAKPPTHPEGINGITASLEMARMRESIGNERFNGLDERASEYFDAFSSILDEMYREGMVSEKLYEQLAGLDYQPRIFLEHMFADMDQNMMTEHRLTGPIIKRLKEGSDKEMLFNSRYLLRIYAKNAFSRIARNKIHKELAKYADTQTWISSSPRTGFSEITFYGEKDRKKGVQQTFYLKNDLYNSLNDVFKYAYLSPKAQNIIGMISGARLLKFFATQVNPLFVVKNIPRDFLHILFFTDFYDKSPLPVAAFRLGMDYISGIKSKITEDKWFNLYIKYGGGMEFLSTEGEESVGLGYVPNAKKTMMGKLGMKTSEVLSKSKEALGYLGELSEIAPRIGVFRALVERNLREANVDIRSGAAEPIIEEAVAMVREIIDFAQGGELTKAGESAIPYLNAAFQGFRVASRYAFVSNPKQFAYKLAQLSVAVFALALYNSSVGDDDMEDISDDIKFRNWIILTPFRDKDGNRFYLKIAKTQQLQSFAYLGEIAAEAFVASQKDREPRINDDLGEVALKAVGGYLPKDVGKLDKEIATANPFLAAIYTYKSNYDAFRDAVVSRDYALEGKNKVFPQYEDFYDKNVPYFYKAIGQGLGVGPKRLQASTEKMITSPHSSLLVMGGYALADSFSRMFELKGPDGLTLKDQSDISKGVAERFDVDAKKIFLGVTNPETKSYEKREQIDESNMDSNTRRMFIKREADKWGQKLYEMRNQPNANTNANIDAYNKTIDSINAELSSIYDKQGEQIAEYFRNRVFVVAKKGSDIPQEYNDLLFASDDLARAKILYMYDKSMSEQEIYDYMGNYSEAVNRNVSREQNIRIAEEYNKLKK
jgi:hypothetical protein